jgi:hypothetical protein
MLKMVCINVSLANIRVKILHFDVLGALGFIVERCLVQRSRIDRLVAIKELDNV